MAIQPVTIPSSGDHLTLQLLTDYANAINDLIDAVNSTGSGGAATGGNSDYPSDPYTRIFLAKMTGASQWKEETVVDGEIADFGTPGTDGRACTDDSDPSAAISAGGESLMLETPDGDDYRYVMIPIPVLVKITSYAGSGPVNWTYTVTDIQGHTYTAYNALEPCNGSPGPLGVNVGSDGTVNGGSCYVQPIGPSAGYVPMWWDGDASKWWFAIPNSAQ
jgi:hypothetical protein